MILDVHTHLGKMRKLDGWPMIYTIGEYGIGDDYENIAEIN